MRKIIFTLAYLIVTSRVHELQHAIDLDEGKLDTKTKTETGVPIAEIDAVNTENRVRVKTGYKKRTTYAGKKISRIWLHN